MEKRRGMNQDYLGTGRLVAVLAALSLSVAASAGPNAGGEDERARRFCDERAEERAVDGRPRRPLCLQNCPVTYEQALRLVAPGVPDADQEATARLLARIGADLAALPATASTGDLEAAIVYAISQSEADPRVVKAALEYLNACNGGRADARDAYRRVRFAVLRSGARGTAALAGAFGRSEFYAPVVSLGGGTSNYAR